MVLAPRLGGGEKWRGDRECRADGVVGDADIEALELSACFGRHWGTLATTGVVEFSLPVVGSLIATTQTSKCTSALEDPPPLV